MRMKEEHMIYTFNSGAQLTVRASNVKKESCEDAVSGLPKPQLIRTCNPLL